MSRVVIGYLNGKPQFRDEGPAVGRRQGFGGVAMGAFAGTVLAVAPAPKVKLPRQPLSVTRPKP